MSFAYEVLSDAEIEKERANLMEPGTYNFEVVKAEYKDSHSGNPMIALQLLVYDNNGISFVVFDYLVSTRKMAWKIKHFCDSVGLTKEYTDGTFDENMCPGKAGKVSIIYQLGKDRPEGGKYPNKNAVEDYVIRDTNAPLMEKAPDFKDNDLPF